MSKGLGTCGAARRLAGAALALTAVVALGGAGPAAAAPSFVAPVNLSAPGSSAFSPRVAVDPAGGAVAVWQRSDGANQIVQAAVRPPGGAFSAPIPLSAPGQNALDPQVALDSAGNGAGTWSRADGADEIVQAAGYDAAGPLLRELSVPASVPAGVPVAMSVSPVDVWSALGPGPVWDFGDGALGAGTAVRHVYPAPGAYTVTVRQADALGNATTASRQIAVGPASAPLAPGRREVVLRARLTLVGRGGRLFLRVVGRAGTAEAGRLVRVERRIGRRVRPLCRARVSRSGGFSRLCRVDQLIRGRRTPIRVRVRLPGTGSARVAVTPFVVRVLVRPDGTAS